MDTMILFYFSGMLPPGFPPIYSSHMMPGHPTDGEPSFHSRPPDLPTLPLPLEPPGHPGSMLLHPSYGAAFPRFSSSLLNLPADHDFEMSRKLLSQETLEASHQRRHSDEKSDFKTDFKEGFSANHSNGSKSATLTTSGNSSEY